MLRDCSAPVESPGMRSKKSGSADWHPASIRANQHAGTLVCPSDRLSPCAMRVRNPGSASVSDAGWPAYREVPADGAVIGSKSDLRVSSQGGPILRICPGAPAYGLSPKTITSWSSQPMAQIRVPFPARRGADRHQIKSSKVCSGRFFAFDCIE